GALHVSDSGSADLPTVIGGRIVLAMVALVVLGVLLAFALGYFVYARYIGERIYEDREDIRTPAYEFEDGTDHVPTNRHILFGHHFTSIAGAAPIIGPCIAAYWGVLPALIWVVLGTIFMGAVHDFGALVVSVREGGRTIADIAGKVITPRVRAMFLVFVMVLTWLVVAVFAMAIAGMFRAIPSSVLPVNLEILVALVMGWLIYKKKVGALLPSILALGLLYLFIYFGQTMRVDLTAEPGTENTIFAMGWAKGTVTNFWVVFLFLYAGVASLLPVWMLLQPRDYINSHQLLVGLGLLFAGVIWANPQVDAPWIRDDVSWFARGEDGTPPLIPFLFVTIACGAISGFHALVASGTTSKQVKSLRDTRLIGYGSMLGEGSLALASVLAAVCGIALVGQCDLPGQGAVSDLSWAGYYDTWSHAAQNKATAFVLGGAQFLQSIGVPSGYATTMMAVLVVSFAATTLDTATRIQRFVITELGGALRIQPLTNRYLATVLALLPALILVFGEAKDPSGQTTQMAWLLWPIFGASNQMMAALTLMVLSVYFWRRRKPILPLLVPMLFVMAITVTALVLQMGAYLQQDNYLLVGVSAVLLAMILWMLLEGIGLVAQIRRTKV
ncbi:MAG: carbon starvation protein A, partial [Planctomycetota bacterium]|nr:carbon starvation protein A [Planctomycetota bacterium]